MNEKQIRSRIKDHRKLKASEIKPHPQNWRLHPQSQLVALRASLEQIGFARSLLAYEDPEWGLTLIDGHARLEEMQDQEIEIEVLDVTREEAKALLLSLDPLTTLAGTDEEQLAQLISETETESAALANLWNSISQSEIPEEEEQEFDKDSDDIPEQHLVIITCKNEKHQAEVLAACNKKGWKCKPMTG